MQKATLEKYKAGEQQHNLKINQAYQQHKYPTRYSLRYKAPPKLCEQYNNATKH